MSNTRAVLFSVMFCLAACFTVSAQRAVLTGAVSDQKGAEVSGAKITVLNLDQGLKRDGVTNDEGYFTIPLLQPGHYLVTAQKEGFAVAEIRDVTLHVGEARGLNITLVVGAVPVEVRVSGITQAVETVSSSLGAVVTADVVRNAPLDGRDIRDLALLQPGVTPTDLDYSRNGVGRFNVAGNRADSVLYLLDGGLNNDLIDNHAVYVPNPDTVAEFRVLTSNYPAEYGRNAGGVISLATQTGTNQFHGSLFDFLRNDALDANSYFNKNRSAPLPRNVLKRNQFGGTLGGPLGIPRVVNGKDRFFFFVGYQGERQVQGLSVHDVPVFTPAELKGDFSHSQNGSPDAGVANFLLSNPFFQPDPALAAQGIIDPSRINSVAQQYITSNLVPVSASGLLSSQQPLRSDQDELTGKFDFQITSQNIISATLGWDRAHQVTPFDYADVPGFPNVSDFHDYLTTVAFTHIFTPNLLNELKATAERVNNQAEYPDKRLPHPQQLGIEITPDLPTGPTNLFFDTGLTLGLSVQGPQVFTDNIFSFSDMLSWTKGRHSWKFGGGFSPYQSNTDFSLLVNGQYFFLGQGGLYSGNSFADFLLGLPLQYVQGPAARSNVRSKFTYGFAQDDWRVRKSLVLSLGLRYEYSTPKSDTNGRIFSIVPGAHSHVFVNAPVGLVFPGDRGTPSAVNFPDRNDWAPRVGFAWDPKGDSKTSVRGAFGVFYDILKAEDNLQFNGKPPFYSSTGFQFPPLFGNPTSEPNYLTQPFVAAGIPNPFPSQPPPHNIDFAAAGFLPIGSSGNVFVVDPHLRTPYTYQYHLTIQRQIAANTIAEGSYLGSSSHGLTGLVDVNPFVLGTTNRILNLAPGNQTCDVNTPYLCSFAWIYEFRNATTASYNSLLLSLKKQFNGDGWFGRSYSTVAYTYAHNIDNLSGFENRNSTVPFYDPNRFRTSSDMDVRHRIVFSGGWDIPFSRALQNAPKRLVNGWQIFPIVSWRTGFPLDVFANLASQFNFASAGPSGAGDAGLVRANVVGPVRLLDPRTYQSLSGEQQGHYWFDPSSFSNTGYPTDAEAVANPAARTYGTLPRNYLRGPGGYNINLAVSKITPIHEQVSLEARADFFNLLNHANFGNPDVNISSPTFGQVLYTAQARVIQLALRLKF